MTNDYVTLGTHQPGLCYVTFAFPRLFTHFANDRNYWAQIYDKGFLVSRQRNLLTQLLPGWVIL